MMDIVFNICMLVLWCVAGGVLIMFNIVLEDVLCKVRPNRTKGRVTNGMVLVGMFFGVFHLVFTLTFGLQLMWEHVVSGKFKKWLNKEF